MKLFWMMKYMISYICFRLVMSFLCYIQFHLIKKMVLAGQEMKMGYYGKKK